MSRDVDVDLVVDGDDHSLPKLKPEHRHSLARILGLLAKPMPMRSSPSPSR
jgi:hypothetical protein